MRWIFWASVAVLGVVSLLGLVNNGGDKFVRIKPEDGCIASFANIYDSWLQDIVCCTAAHDDHGVCPRARYALTTKILTSGWAFAIPLLGFLVNVAAQRLTGVVTAARSRAHRNRLLLYVGVILARTVVLYLAMNVIQDNIQAEESSDCWYASLRRSGRCSEHFDFADHVVLAACQYFAIQVFELYCAIIEYCDSVNVTTTSLATAPRCLRFAPPVVSACVCLFVARHSLILMYETAVYFHSRAETAVALLISWFFVGRYLKVLLGADGRRSSATSGWVTGDGQVDRKSGLKSPSRGLFLEPLPNQQ